MKKIIRTIIFMLIAIAIILVACVVLAKSDIDTPVDGIGNAISDTAINTALEATGIKQQAESALRSYAPEIADKIGVPVAAVDSAIDDLDIESWNVTTPSSDATVKNTESIQYQGMDVTVTNYDDPSIVTLGVGGQEVTFEVPSSAQSYLRLIDQL